MLSKPRLLLFVLVLLALGGGSIAVGVALDMSLFWTKVLAGGVMIVAAGFVLPLGWLRKAPKE